jgi:hypothetical protein
MIRLTTCQDIYNIHCSQILCYRGFDGILYSTEILLKVALSTINQTDLCYLNDPYPHCASRFYGIVAFTLKTMVMKIGSDCGSLR